MVAAMGRRAQPSGIALTAADVAIVKAMLARGDRQHDVAAWFGVNGGRIAEIASGERFRDVAAQTSGELPPPGPYPGRREAVAALDAVRTARQALDQAEQIVLRYAQP